MAAPAPGLFYYGVLCVVQWPCLVTKKILQNFSDSPSHQIFRRMHEVLNIDKNKKLIAQFGWN
jgi:hypothetical protein